MSDSVDSKKPDEKAETKPSVKPEAKPEGFKPERFQPHTVTPPGGVSQFVDVFNVLYGTQAIYGVSNIAINRDYTLLKGKDNNKLRIVSTHRTDITETISFDCEDVNAMLALKGLTGAATLSFVWKAVEQTLTTNALPSQTVTITGVVIEKVDLDAMTRNFGKGKITATIIGVADGSEPITYAAYTGS